MIPVHQCEDISDTVPLFPVKGLFFKPISRIHVSVHYPQLKQSLPNGGKTVSSWEIMEKLKALLAPDKFISIRVVKNTLEFIRFEGDLENRNVMKTIMGRLEGKSLKITGFKEPMKIRVAEAKIPFPSKYDWDSFFRDAKNMNEMKAGERPDTIHLQNLPCKWFSDHPSDEKPIPSEKLFRRIWETFGDIRSIDIPIADPYRTKMQSSIAGIKTFTFSSDAVFEAYVQYKDYMSFVRAMDALRGCYVLFQENMKYWVANVKVDFDKSKHLSEESIRRRRQERERLMEKEKKEKMSATLSRLEEKEKARREIEEKKKEADKSQVKLDYKIAMEERKYIIARRKLEAIRLMDFLFERLKRKLKESKRSREKEEANLDLHEKIMGKYKLLQESRVEEQHKKLKKVKKTKRHLSSQHGSGMESYDDHQSFSRSRSRERSRSQSPDRKSRSHTPRRSRSHSPLRSRSRSRERYKSRSRSRSRSRRRSTSAPRNRSRSRSRSRGSRRSRSRGRSIRRSRSRSIRRSRSGSRTRTTSRTRSRSRSQEGYRYDRDRRHLHHSSERYDRGSPHRYNSGGRHYERGRDPHYHHNEGYHDGDKRGPYRHEEDRYRSSHEFETRGRGRGGYMPRGHFIPNGAPGPYRGRGRGTFPSRYIGDWELRDRENSHIHNPPPHGPMPMPYPNGPYEQPPEFFRGRGRGGFRGRGRGYYPHHHYQNYHHGDYGGDNGQVVHRDFTYLEELDRAYEKYFKSITEKKD